MHSPPVVIEMFFLFFFSSVNIRFYGRKPGDLSFCVYSFKKSILPENVSADNAARSPRPPTSASPIIRYTPYAGPPVSIQIISIHAPFILSLKYFHFARKILFYHDLPAVGYPAVDRLHTIHTYPNPPEINVFFFFFSIVVHFACLTRIVRSHSRAVAHTGAH